MDRSATTWRTPATPANAGPVALARADHWGEQPAWGAVTWRGGSGKRKRKLAMGLVGDLGSDTPWDWHIYLSIGVVLGVNEGKYAIHGVFGLFG